MPTIFLYRSAPTPTTIILSDPTIPRIVSGAISATLFGGDANITVGLLDVVTVEWGTAIQQLNTTIQSLAPTPQTAEALTIIKIAMASVATFEQQILEHNVTFPESLSTVMMILVMKSLILAQQMKALTPRGTTLSILELEEAALSVVYHRLCQKNFWGFADNQSPPQQDFPYSE